MTNTLEIQLRNHFDELPALGERITEFLESRDTGADVVFAANLAAEELVTNIVKYGYDDEGAHLITVRLTLDAESLWMEIEDDGHEFNPFDLPEPDTTSSVEEREIGGLGIHFVRNLLDECSYQRSATHNRVTLRKKRSLS